PSSSITLQTRFASAGLTVGTRLMARDTVAVETLARFAISRMSISPVQKRRPDSSTANVIPSVRQGGKADQSWPAEFIHLLPPGVVIERVAQRNIEILYVRMSGCNGSLTWAFIRSGKTFAMSLLEGGQRRQNYRFCFEVSGTKQTESDRDTEHTIP